MWPGQRTFLAHSFSRTLTVEPSVSYSGHDQLQGKASRVEEGNLATNNLSRRDFGYTIYSRVETCVRMFVAPVLDLHWSEKPDWIPDGVLLQALTRHNNIEFDSAYDLL